MEGDGEVFRLNDLFDSTYMERFTCRLSAIIPFGFCFLLLALSSHTKLWSPKQSVCEFNGNTRLLFSSYRYSNVRTFIQKKRTNPISSRLFSSSYLFTNLLNNKCRRRNDKQSPLARQIYATLSKRFNELIT